MERGWIEHIPLTYLTDRRCVPGTDIDLHSQGFTIDKRGGNLLTIEKPLNEAEEYHLTFEEWHQAWPRLLELIEEYQPNILFPWKSHFNRIVSAHDRSSNWNTWIQYDIQIRKQSLHEPIDPSIYHAQIWRDIDLITAKRTMLDLI